MARDRCAVEVDVAVREWKVSPVVMGFAGFLLAIAPFSRAEVDVDAIVNALSTQIAGNLFTGNLQNQYRFRMPDCATTSIAAANPASNLQPLLQSVSNAVPSVAPSNWSPGQPLPGITGVPNWDKAYVSADPNKFDPSFHSNCKTLKEGPKFMFCGDLSAKAEQLAPLWYEEWTGHKPDHPLELVDL